MTASIDNLRDYHLPDQMLWWPPAPGWWLLLASIIIIAIMSYGIYRRIQRHKLRKQALTELVHVQQQYEKHQNLQRLAQDVSVLLRRICISQFPRLAIASLTGDQWLLSIEKITGQAIFNQEQGQILTQAPYNPKIQYDSQILIQCCRQWINALPTPAKDKHHDLF